MKQLKEMTDRFIAELNEDMAELHAKLLAMDRQEKLARRRMWVTMIAVCLPIAIIFWIAT